MDKYDKWHNFIDFIQNNPKNSNWEFFNNPKIYDEKLTDKLFDFFEECRNNHKNDKGNYHSTAYDFIEKLKILRDKQFSKLDIEAINLPTLEALQIIENNRVLLVLKSQYKTYDLAINYLNKYLPETKSQEISKTTTIQNKNVKPPRYQSFTAKIDNYYLREAWRRMMKLGLISDIEFDSFERIFTGRIPAYKISWTAGPGSLHYFIQKINGKGVNYIKNQWMTTANCFTIKGKTFDNVYIKKNHDPIKKNIWAVDQILKLFYFEP